MAEEHRFQAPQLCANNCGFFGSPATHNLCSKCYRDLHLKERQSSSAKQALNQAFVCSSLSPSSFSVSLTIKEESLPDNKEYEVNTAAAVEEEVQAQQVRPNKCLTYNKRVGLTGFKCRCGMVFCGTHRYPEHHGCTFDFKGMGKEQIAKANPVVKGEKLQKI